MCLNFCSLLLFVLLCPFANEKIHILKSIKCYSLSANFKAVVVVAKVDVILLCTTL